MIGAVPVVVGPGFGVQGPVGAPVGGGFGAGGGFPSITGLPAVGVSPAALPDVGFQVAGGDSVGLDAAATTFTDIEEQLREHATSIQTAPQCAPTWTGEAAHAYANLSVLVAAHFQNAANTAADAHDALQRWSTELHRCQREGITAVNQAQHYLAEIKTQQLALTTAQTDTATTQIALAAAQANLALAHALAPATAAATPRLQADATAAQNALTTAQAAAHAARTKLDDAHHQLAVWQARGRQAWQDAEHAAQTATHTLTPLLITPPPLAGLPTPLTPNPPFTGPADPNCQNQTGRTTNTNTSSLPTQLRNLAAGIAGISPSAAAALLALAKALEDGQAEEEDAANAVGFASKAEARSAFDGQVGTAANRFFRGATSKSTDFQATELQGGGQRFEFFSPANNPGYGKLYVQEVDAQGDVIQEYKDTMGPQGLIERKFVRGGP